MKQVKGLTNYDQEVVVEDSHCYHKQPSVQTCNQSLSGAFTKLDPIPTAFDLPIEPLTRWIPDQNEVSFLLNKLHQFPVIPLTVLLLLVA